MKKKYDSYVVGYYGMKNSGDDALMCASDLGVQLMKQKSTNLITSQSTQGTPLDSKIALPPRSAIKGLPRLSHYKNALQSKNVIFGGGSVLHSQKDIAFKHHLLRLSGGEYSRCVGVGIEPFNSVETERACADLLNAMPFVGVRDNLSYAIATSISPTANIHLTFDLAPTLLLRNEQLTSTGPRKGVAFNFCPRAVNAFNHVDEEQENIRIAKAVELIINVAEKLKEAVYLVDFNGNEKCGDVSVHRKIVAQLPQEIIVYHIPYDSNPYRLMRRLSGMKAMVGMRLHAAILSFLVDTPCLSLNYHSKCVGWCEQIGLPHEYRFDSENFVPSDILRTLKLGIGTGFARSNLSIDKARVAALQNWRKPE